MNTVRIWFENLVTTRGDRTKLPLSELKNGDHLHGGLRLEFSGRLVPGLGYFGPDNVCFNTWMTELHAVAQAFQQSDYGHHIFDEGEQGQSAFVFERAEDIAFFTISEGAGGGGANPHWQRVQFLPQDFLAEYELFCERFLATIRAAAPKGARKWIVQNVPNSKSG